MKYLSDVVVETIPTAVEPFWGVYTIIAASVIAALAGFLFWKAAKARHGGEQDFLVLLGGMVLAVGGLLLVLLPGFAGKIAAQDNMNTASLAKLGYSNVQLKDDGFTGADKDGKFVRALLVVQGDVTHVLPY